MRLNVESITRESRFWDPVNILAKEAFPPEEYLAPSELVKMAQSDSFDFLALLDEGTFVGFMVVMLYEDMAYLFFLAIDENNRGKGYCRIFSAVCQDALPHRLCRSKLWSCSRK